MYVSQNVCEFIYKPISNGLLQQLHFFFFKWCKVVNDDLGSHSPPLSDLCEMSGIFQRILFCSAFLLWIKRQHQHRFLLLNSHKVLFSNVCSVPCSRWKNHLQFGHASIHRHQELDIVEGHGRGHGVPVVFVVYPQVRGGGLTLPAHYQVQRRGLVALRRYLRTQNRGVITFSRGDIPNVCGDRVSAAWDLILQHVHVVVRRLGFLFCHLLQVGYEVWHVDPEVLGISLGLCGCVTGERM